MRHPIVSIPISGEAECSDYDMEDMMTYGEVLPPPPQGREGEGLAADKARAAAAEAAQQQRKQRLEALVAKRK